jgi:DNA-binding NarL/FixJ family response regulator
LNALGKISTCIKFIDLPVHHKPDMILMCIDMPNMNGLEATRKSLKLVAELKIIAFSMFYDKQYYSKLIDRWFLGFNVKTSGINELKIAIKHVIMGESTFRMNFQDKLSIITDIPITQFD